MTLKEAYELKKKEVFSLRIENTRLQKQAVVLRSDTGGQYICDALTILETARSGIHYVINY